MRNCWICNHGKKGNGLCPQHKAEAQQRAARYNISEFEAVSQMGVEARELADENELMEEIERTDTGQ